MEIKKKEAFIGEETRGSWSQIPRENGERKKRVILACVVGSARDSSLRTRATSVYRARPLECNDWPESLQIRLDPRTSLRAFTSVIRITRK